MPGFLSSISNGEEIVFAENADFSGNVDPSQANGLQTNGQLWIGTTTPNAGGTQINVGTITSPDGSVTVGYASPNITLQVAGGTTTVEKLKPNWDFDGSAATDVLPQSGRINVLGYNPSPTNTATNFVTASLNSNGTNTGNLQFEHRAWTTQYIVDSSTTVGTRGTYSTITSAITAASGAGGGIVLIRAGTYTENFTMVAGVDVVSFLGAGYTPEVTILGKITASYTGRATISGVRLKTNGDYALSITGTNATILTVANCFIEALDSTAIQMSNSNASSIVFLRYCVGSITGAAQTYFTKSGANSELNITHCILRNEGGSSVSSTVSDGTVDFSYTNIHVPVDTSSSGTLRSRHTHFRPGIKCGTIAGNTCIYENCTFRSLTATALTVTSTASLYNCSILCTNSTIIDGAGNVTFGNVSFEGSGLITTTTQSPLVCTNNAVKVKSPGAYPYTTVPSDGVILVDTSSARTINLNASPVTGQMYRIKDNVGSAGTNAVTITPAAGNIDGAGSYSLNVNYGSVDVVYSGSGWFVL